MGNNSTAAKVIISIIFIISCFYHSRAQTISAISKSICDSINKLEYRDEAEMASLQLGIYHKELVKYPTLIVDITNLNKPRQFNEFNYRINRELLQTCPSFIDQFALLPLTKILDLENLFNKDQYDSLERAIIEFIYFKKMDLVVITVDDTYPYQNMQEFASGQLEKLKVGARYKNGGLIITLNSSTRVKALEMSKAENDLYSKSDIVESVDEWNKDMTFQPNSSQVSGILKFIESLSEK